MKLLNTAALVICGILSFAAVVAPARASTVTYDWTLSGPAASLGGVPAPGSGTITATVSNTGSETLTAITGTIGGSAITGLTSFFGSDNLVYPSGTTPIDTSGIAFTDAAGQSINIFSFYAEGSVVQPGNNFGEYISGGGGFGVGTFSLAPVAATPLPPTWTMMILGLFGFGFIAFRGTKKHATGFVAA